jgi:hypothetical protein
MTQALTILSLLLLAGCCGMPVLYPRALLLDAEQAREYDIFMQTTDC